MGGGTTAAELAAAVRRGDAETVEALLASQPTLSEACADDGVPLLLLALYHRREDLAEAIAARRGALSLLEGAALGRVDVVRERLAAAEAVGQRAVSQRSVDGFTPLHYGAFFGREEVVAELLAHGADVSAVAENATRVQPLHSAAAIRSVPICRRLLEAGADPDARQQAGFTALMSAALHGDHELAELLLAHGADRRVAAEDGRTASDMAREGGYRDLAARLAADS